MPKASTAFLGRLDVLLDAGSVYFSPRFGLTTGAAADVLLQEDPDALIGFGRRRAGAVDAAIDSNEVDPDRQEPLLREGIRLHDLGVQGNRTAASWGRTASSKQAFELDSDDPLLLRAYYGSAAVWPKG